MPSIAIVTPCYNDSHFLISWVKEVMKQGFDEIIIADDKSTDNTSKILNTLKTLYPIKVVTTEKKGAFNAYMATVYASKSDYICSSSCDDYPLPGFLNKMRDAMFDYPLADLYLCSAVVRRENEFYQRRLLDFDAYVDPMYSKKIFKSGLGRQLPVSGNICKRDVIIKCWEGGGNKLNANLDCLINFYCMFSKGFVYLRDGLYLYRSYPSSFGASGKNKDIKEANNIIWEFLFKNLTPISFRLFVESGLCRGKESWLPQLALSIIMKLPKPIRRKFYQWFYGYNWKIEKL